MRNLDERFGVEQRRRSPGQHFAAFFAVPCLLLSCAAIGHGLMDGATDSLQAKGPAVVHDSTVAARNALAEPETAKALLDLEKAVLDGAREGAIGAPTQAKLQELLDTSFATLNGNADRARENLLGVGLLKNVADVREEALGNKTKAKLDILKSDLLGKETDKLAKDLVDTALNDDTLDRVRERLVGQPLSDSIDAVIKRAAATARSELPTLLNAVFPQLNNELKTAENRVVVLLVILAAVVVIAVILSAAALYYFKKHRQIIRVIAKKVEAYQSADLKQSIKQAADAAGVEDYLHMLLKKNGIPVNDNDDEKKNEQPPAPRVA